MDKEAWHAAVHGVAKGWIWLSDWTELMSFMLCHGLPFAFILLPSLGEAQNKYREINSLKNNNNLHKKVLQILEL